MVIGLIAVVTVLISVVETRKNNKNKKKPPGKGKGGGGRGGDPQPGGGRGKHGGGGFHANKQGGRGGGGGQNQQKKKHHGRGVKMHQGKKQAGSGSDSDEYYSAGEVGNMFKMFFQDGGSSDTEDYSDDDYDESSEYVQRRQKHQKKNQKQQKQKHKGTVEKTPSRQTTFATTTPYRSTKSRSGEQFEQGMKKIEKLKNENYYELQRYNLTTKPGFWEDWTATYVPIPLQFTNVTPNYAHLHWNKAMLDRTPYPSCPTRFRELFFGTRPNGEPIFLHYPKNDIHYLKPWDYVMNHFESYGEMKRFIAKWYPDESFEANVTAMYDTGEASYEDTKESGPTTVILGTALVDSNGEYRSFHKNPNHDYTDEWYENIYSTEESDPSYPTSDFKTSCVWNKIRCTRTPRSPYKVSKDKLKKDKRAFERKKKEKKKQEQRRKEKSISDSDYRGVIKKVLHVSKIHS